MKLIYLFLIVFTFSSNAQWSSSAVKLGHFSPVATEGGFIIGYEGNHFIDNNFMFGWSIDWFNKNFVDKRLVGEFNQFGIGSGSINELRAKTNLHDFPVMISLTAKFPVYPRLKMFVTGGIGAELLLIFYRNFQNPEKDEITGAYDFNWRLGLGSLFEVGPRSDLFIEFSYHASNPSWEFEGQDSFGNPKTFERSFDMSGLMARLGFRFYY